MAAIVFDHVEKVYPDGTHAVHDLNLEIHDGEFVVLVGPSGCGKTTALRMVAGLEEISDGEIRLGDRVVNDLDPRDRDIAMVFQNYALYPHMSVFDNLAFGLRMRGVSRRDRALKVLAAARALGMEDYLDRKPAQLSGGQRQRVAMGRAIVREPQAFLMDEPLSNLDAKLRVQMRAEIARIQRELGATTIFVTHDQVEAMTMGDRVAVLRRGLLQQVDVPQRLYEAPANLFVASFIGSPPMNLLEVEIERDDGGVSCLLGESRLRLTSETPAMGGGLEAYLGRKVALGIRPERLRDAGVDIEGGEDARLSGVVALTEALGPELLVHVDIAATPVVREEALEGIADLDEAVVSGLKSGAEKQRATIVGRLPAGSRLQPGEAVELAVDTSGLHFFDLDTGVAISGSLPIGVAGSEAGAARGFR